MKNDINILILSVGTRNLVVNYFKEELLGLGKVYATDSNFLAPALYEADEHFIVPKIDHPAYIETILTICKDKNINGVLSLIDPELSLLAKYKDRFEEIGTFPIISDSKIVDTCFDKLDFYHFLKENNFKAINTYSNKDDFLIDLHKGDIQYPVIIKPRMGSASINVYKAHNSQEVEMIFEKFDNMLIQPWFNAEEFGVDAYIDIKSKELVSFFIKKKIKMKAGETHQSVSSKDIQLFEVVREFIKKAGFIGVIDIDILKKDDHYYILEVNPRFGGGYPHAHASGVNIVKMIVHNLKNKVNIQEIWNYNEGKYMMKFYDIKIL